VRRSMGVLLAQLGAATGQPPLSEMVGVGLPPNPYSPIWNSVAANARVPNIARRFALAAAGGHRATDEVVAAFIAGHRERDLPLDGCLPEATSIHQPRHISIPSALTVHGAAVTQQGLDAPQLVPQQAQPAAQHQLPAESPWRLSHRVQRHI
jgi:hypothetical protein